jgi:hypothetical protein
MTEYYVTSELINAVAAIKQGFELQEYAYNHITQGIIWEDYDVDFFTMLCLDADKWRFPKTPHNMALMQPILDDIVTWYEEGSYSELRYVGIVSQVLNNGCSLYIKENTRKHHPYKSSDQVTVIQRNNMPFPLWDEERS